MTLLAGKTVEIADVQHIKLHGNRDVFCGHPRQGGIYNFGDGELAVIHYHAPCKYEVRQDVRHDEGGYHSRAVALLQRSLDNGESWPDAQDVTIWDESLPLEERRQLLFPSDASREIIDMSRPESVFYFGRSWSGEEQADGSHTIVCFALRSADKGQTWERVPTIVQPPRHLKGIHKDAHPVVTMPDGTFLATMTGGGGSSAPGQVLIYGSDDDGVTWEYLSEVARDATGDGRPTYAGLLLLPSGELLCFMLQLGGRGNFLGLSRSKDGGYSWSDFVPIVRWGQSPWRARRRSDQPGAPGVFYRSPWPMILQDGRILLLFARRKPPFGIGGMISDDDGHTWSQEFVVRDDGNMGDLGYPVATQLADGRIFTAYYFNVDDGNNFGGSRFIGGSFFRLTS